MAKTHEEFKQDWNEKHRAAFADINDVLQKHGLTGTVTGLSLRVPKAILTQASADQDCSSAFKKPPCGPGKKIQICTCSDGTHIQVFKCCV
jgi:hypothetical protein